MWSTWQGQNWSLFLPAEMLYLPLQVLFSPSKLLNLSPEAFSPHQDIVFRLEIPFWGWKWWFTEWKKHFTRWKKKLRKWKKWRASFPVSRPEITWLALHIFPESHAGWIMPCCVLILLRLQDVQLRMIMKGCRIIHYK